MHGSCLALAPDSAFFLLPHGTGSPHRLHVEKLSASPARKEDGKAPLETQESQRGQELGRGHPTASTGQGGELQSPSRKISCDQRVWPQVPPEAGSGRCSPLGSLRALILRGLLGTGQTSARELGGAAWLVPPHALGWVLQPPPNTLCFGLDASLCCFMSPSCRRASEAAQGSSQTVSRWDGREDPQAWLLPLQNPLPRGCCLPTGLSLPTLVFTPHGGACVQGLLLLAFFWLLGGGWRVAGEEVGQQQQGQASQDEEGSCNQERSRVAPSHVPDPACNTMEWRVTSGVNGKHPQLVGTVRFNRGRVPTPSPPRYQKVKPSPLPSS